MKGKLEDLFERVNCPEREKNKEGLEYCRSNDRTCPYIDKNKYVTLFMGTFRPCKYHTCFDEIVMEETHKKV